MSTQQPNETRTTSDISFYTSRDGARLYPHSLHSGHWAVGVYIHGGFARNPADERGLFRFEDRAECMAWVAERVGGPRR